MPLYEFRCLDCKRRFEARLSYEEYGQKAIQCAHCQSERVQRRISRVRVAKSEESRLESLADPAQLEGLDEDPQALARMMRTMSGQLGEEMPAEFDEVVNRLEAGQSPEEIDAALPDLGEGGFGADDF